MRSPRDIGKYVIDEGASLGTGCYGKVYPAYHRETKARFACKQISKKKLYDMEVYSRYMMMETQEQFYRYINFHFKLNNNKHIVKLYDVEQDECAYYLFMEYCDSDIGKLLKARKKFPEEYAVKLIKQLCIGYDAIYRQKASHRDLKPYNLLLKQGVLKIADFGFVKEIAFSTDSVTRSKLKTQIKDKQYLRASTICGTPGYIPPNAVDSQLNSQLSYDFYKFDMWSIGIIFYYMLYGQRPFEGTSQEEIYKSMSTKDVVFPEGIPVSEKTKSIIYKLLNKNEYDRIEFRLLVKYLGIEYLYGKKSTGGGLRPYRSSIEKRGSTVKSSKTKSAEAKLTYIDFLSKLIKLLYVINTKFSFFRKTFKYIPFAYQLMSRLHYERMTKIKYITMHDVYKDAIKESMGRFVALNSAAEEYYKTFYASIKELATSIQGGFAALYLLIKRFHYTMKIFKKYDIDCLDFEIRKAILAILRLGKYTEDKIDYLVISLDLEPKDHEKMSYWLAIYI